MLSNSGVWNRICNNRSKHSYFLLSLTGQGAGEGNMLTLLRARDNGLNNCDLILELIIFA